MKARKTPVNQRETYTYEFSSQIGRQKVTIHPQDGMSGWIKKLHSLDDSEVYYESKYLGVRSMAELSAWNAYEQDHYSIESSRGHASLDFDMGDGSRQDRLPFMKSIAYENPTLSDREYRLHELMNQLPTRQREVLTLVGLEGYSQTEVAALLGLGKSTVNEHLRKAQKFIRENFYQPEQTDLSL